MATKRTKLEERDAAREHARKLASHPEFKAFIERAGKDQYVSAVRAEAIGVRVEFQALHPKIAMDMLDVLESYRKNPDGPLEEGCRGTVEKRHLVAARELRGHPPVWVAAALAEFERRGKISTAVPVPSGPDCSFCGVRSAESITMVQGPGVAICETCVMISIRVLSQLLRDRWAFSSSVGRMNPDELAERVGVSKAEIAKIREEWLATWPEAQKLHDAMMRSHPESTARRYVDDPGIDQYPASDEEPSRHHRPITDAELYALHAAITGDSVKVYPDAKPYPQVVIDRRAPPCRDPKKKNPTQRAVKKGRKVHNDAAATSRKTREKRAKGPKGPTRAR